MAINGDTGTPPTRREVPKSREERGLYQSQMQGLHGEQQARGLAIGAGEAQAMNAEALRRGVPDKRGPPPQVIPGQRAPAPTGVAAHIPT